MSFVERLTQHGIQMLGGGDRIIDIVTAQEGIKTVLWDGLWKSGRKELLHEFIANYEKLVDDAITEFCCTQVFTAVLDCEKRLRIRIECALANCIKQNEKANKIFCEDVRYITRLNNEPPITVKITGAENIIGMPKELVV